MAATIIAYVISILALVVCIGMFLIFASKIIFKGYVGKKYSFIFVTYILAYGFSLFINRTFATTEAGLVFVPDGSVSEEWIVSIATAFWHALKMITLSFDGSKVSSLFAADGWGVLFGSAYVVTGIVGAVFISISIVLIFVKTATSSLKNFLFITFSHKDIYFIFSDPKVSIAKKLGEKLMFGNRDTVKIGKVCICKRIINYFRYFISNIKKQNIVIMVVTRGSLQTQEGTEYKDALVASGFEVWTQNYSSKFAAYLYGLNKKKHSRWAKHRITVLGMFSDDELSSQLALSFKSFIKEDAFVKALTRKSLVCARLNEEELRKKDSEKTPLKDIPLIPLDPKEKTYLRNFRVFVTYHDNDFDQTYNISKDTLHIVNTLSSYDMISTTFVLDNPISNFVDFDELRDKERKPKDNIFHVTFLGLGKINKPIFDKLKIGYQLWGDNVDKVSYHVVDQDTNKTSDYKESYYKKNASAGADRLEVPFLYSVDKSKYDLSSDDGIDNLLGNIKDEKGRFDKDGFEIFIISVGTTHFDIKLARKLHDAILRNINDLERLQKTIIFVRVSDDEKEAAFRSANDTITISQDDVKAGYLFKPVYRIENKGDKVLERKVLDRIVCPIVPFGTDIMMSDFITNKFYRINKVGIAVSGSYDIRCADDPRDYEIVWITKSKAEVFDNIKNVWAIQSQFNLFGLNLNSNLRVINNKGIDFDKEVRAPLTDPTNTFVDCKDENVRLLGRLEHNRWLAAQLYDKKYGQLSKTEFIGYVKVNKFETGNEPKRKNSNDEHICMTTNEGMKWIYETIIKYGNDKEKATAYADKLVFGNDIHQLTNVFDILYKKDD